MRRNFFICKGAWRASGSTRAGREGVVEFSGSVALLLSVPSSALDSLLFDFMLLSLSTLVVDLSFSVKAVDGPGMGGVDGVFDPEE